MRRMALALSILTLAVGCRPSVAQPPPWLVVVSPDNALAFQILADGESWLSWSPVGWGPNWAWRSVSASGRGQAGQLDVSTTFAATDQPEQQIRLRQRVSQPGPNQVLFRYSLSAAADVPLTALVTAWTAAESAKGGRATLTVADGSQQTVGMGFARAEGADSVTRIVLDAGAGREVTADIRPSIPVRFDNGLRFVLAEQQYPAGDREIELRLTFPAAASLVVSEEDLQRYTTVVPGNDWYPFTGSADVGPSVLGFETWLERPAGSRGGVRLVEDRFELADGTPIKFFGTNLSYALSAPAKADAPILAQRFAKWGVNAVRMHKFTNPVGWEGIGDPNDLTKMDPDGLDRLDNFASELAKAGVYYGWSHSFGVTVRPGNRDRLLAPDEVLGHDNGKTYALINLAPDIQDLLIETVVNLLRHRNPYTGQTYAEDPALCFIELQNEDDIFFYTTEQALADYPTYAAATRRRFAEWLRRKYASEDGLKAAWQDALKADETLATGNIGLQGNPWFYGQDHLPQQTGGERTRLLDNAAFFHDLQNEFYSKFVAAIRATGYEGPLCGSPWQAPAMLPHYYNLRSDALVGFIDRHNYFGEKPGDTMLATPGSGYLSSGLQQVAGRPFGLSEWITVYPALYSAEGPPLVAAYGLGLQGWDASYEFQSGGGGQAWSQLAGSPPFGVWNVDTPTQLGQYPLLARMVARGDVVEGKTISTRRVGMAQLKSGQFDFSDRVDQAGDVKRFGGSVPAAALALGRCLVEFTDNGMPSELLAQDQLPATGPIVSNTGQLSWDAESRRVTINTAGTKGLIGFGPVGPVALGEIEIGLDSGYGSILVTASEPGSDLSDCGVALVSAVARVANSGFTIFSIDQRTLHNGSEPMLVEPVDGTIRFRRQVARVNLLDHDGRRTDRLANLVDNALAIRGAADRTPYYEVVFAAN